MAIKLADTLAPMANFPAVEAQHVDIEINNSPKSLQQAYEDGDLGGGDTIQYDTLPNPVAGLLGKIVQYVGTTGTYKNGIFYKCVSDGELTNTYSWEELKFSADIDNTLSNVSENPVQNKIIKEALDTKLEKVDELPTASVDELGKIYQFVGETGTYKNAYFYRCDYVEADDEYVWTEIVYGSNLQEGDGIDITNDTISVVNRLVVTDTMPTASASLLDATRLYVGTTTSDFSKGGIYQCQSDGEGGYVWTLISVADVDLSQYKKIYINEQAEWDELTTEEKTSYDMATITDDIATGFPVLSDVVLDGDENPVTSNAVYNHNRIYNIQLTSITINAGSNYTVSLSDYDINTNGKPWMAFIWNRSSFGDLNCFGDGSTNLLIHNGEAENKTGNIYISVMVQE